MSPADRARARHAGTGGAVECRLRRLCNRGTGVARGRKTPTIARVDDANEGHADVGASIVATGGSVAAGGALAAAREMRNASARHVALPRTTTSTSGSTQRRRVDCASQKTRPRAAPRAFTTRSSPGSVPPLSRARHPCVGVEGRMRLASRSCANLARGVTSRGPARSFRFSTRASAMPSTRGSVDAAPAGAEARRRTFALFDASRRDELIAAGRDVRVVHMVRHAQVRPAPDRRSHPRSAYNANPDTPVPFRASSANRARTTSTRDTATLRTWTRVSPPSESNSARRSPPPPRTSSRAPPSSSRRR